MTADGTSYGTRFTESEAILAAHHGDTVHLQDLVRDMLPGERAELRRACHRLIAEIDAHEEGRRPA